MLKVHKTIIEIDIVTISHLYQFGIFCLIILTKRSHYSRGFSELKHIPLCARIRRSRYRLFNIIGSLAYWKKNPLSSNYLNFRKAPFVVTYLVYFFVGSTYNFCLDISLLISDEREKSDKEACLIISSLISYRNNQKSDGEACVVIPWLLLYYNTQKSNSEACLVISLLLSYWNHKKKCEAGLPYNFIIDFKFK